MGATDPVPVPLTNEALRALLDAMPQGLVLVSDRDEVLYANPLARELLGDALVLGRRVPWPVTGRDAGTASSVLGGVLRATRFLLGETQRLALVVLTALTPTEHSYVETGPVQHLQEIEAIAQLGSWSWEVDEEAIDWSDGLYRLYGLEPQSVPITFASYVRMTPPEIRDQIVGLIEHCIEAGSGYAFTTRLPERGDGRRWRHSRANTVTVDGRVTRMFGTSQDVTERMLTEELLRESLRQADRLADENEKLRAEVEAQLREVRASRARIVQAADTAGQRLERDLRDGAQRRLATVGAILRSAQAELEPVDESDLVRTLAQAVAELEAGSDELRTLARGLHPALLTDEGLATALGALADRSPVPVTYRADSVGSLPPAVESAAYFVVSEALTNVVKHARASHVQVTVERDAGVVVVEVSDDGIGGAGAEAGSGLRGLSDRVAALGGSLRLDSPPGGGTLLRAELSISASRTEPARNRLGATW